MTYKTNKVPQCVYTSSDIPRELTQTQSDKEIPELSLMMKNVFRFYAITMLGKASQKPKYF